MGCAPSRPELRRSVAHPARPHLFGKHYLLAKTYAAWYGALVHARAFRVEARAIQQQVKEKEEVVGPQLVRPRCDTLPLRSSAERGRAERATCERVR